MDNFVILLLLDSSLFFNWPSWVSLRVWSFFAVVYSCSSLSYAVFKSPMFDYSSFKSFLLALSWRRMLFWLASTVLRLFTIAFLLVSWTLSNESIFFLRALLSFNSSALSCLMIAAWWFSRFSMFSSCEERSFSFASILDLSSPCSVFKLPIEVP